MRTTFIAILAAAATLAGCGEKKTAQQEAMPGMGNMAGMQGMEGMQMRSDSLLPLMRVHLDSLAAIPAQFLGSMLPAHDALASRMLDAMGADMIAMNMKADPSWTALTDSIRLDLADLPALSGRPLETWLKAHIDRMRRLMAMHETMTRTM
ncbi:MAG: hypothetical protein ACRDFT_03430 [bacterium]